MECTFHCTHGTHGGQIQFQPHYKFWGRSLLILVTLRFLALFGVGVVGQYMDNYTCFSFYCIPQRFLYGECLKHSTTERLPSPDLRWCWSEHIAVQFGYKVPRKSPKKRLGNVKLDIRQTELGIINFSELSHFFRRMKQQVSVHRMWSGQLKEACFSGARLWNGGWCPESAMLGTAYDLMLTPSTDQYYCFSVEITF